MSSSKKLVTPWGETINLPNDAIVGIVPHSVIAQDSMTGQPVQIDGSMVVAMVAFVPMPPPALWMSIAEAKKPSPIVTPADIGGPLGDLLKRREPGSG